MNIQIKLMKYVIYFNIIVKQNIITDRKNKVKPKITIDNYKITKTNYYRILKQINSN